MMFARTFLNATTGLVWHDGENSCVLRDDDRYFGHVVKSRSWRAYGATKPHTSTDELMYLGRFKTREEAKAALTNAAALPAPNGDEAKKIEPVACEERPRVRTAGC
jgi:hypothetical protein